MGQAADHSGIKDDAAAPARAEDAAYLINHVIACTVTDFIDPYVGSATQKMLGRRFSVGCGEGHEHFGQWHAHAPDAHGKLGHSWLGELAGDFLSVPVALGVQRFAPRLVEGLRKGLETAAGPLMRKSAERSARRQAQAFGQTPDETLVKARAQEIYGHEMQHLPLAAIWTASSVAINIATQKLAGNSAPLWQITAGKMAGTAVSSGATVGLRMLAPQTAQRWDAFSSEKLWLPATRKIGALFGVDGETVDRMAEKQHALKQQAAKPQSWAQRAQAEREQQKDAPAQGR